MKKMNATSRITSLVQVVRARGLAYVLFAMSVASIVVGAVEMHCNPTAKIPVPSLLGTFGSLLVAVYVPIQVERLSRRSSRPMR